VGDRLGLSFPPERWEDLRRGVAAAATEFGIKDVVQCAGWLLGEPPSEATLKIVSKCLTVGETYFFREKQAFDELANRILPELIRSRRGRSQYLRFWSAGCCTGEEAYSLAILLRQLLPDLEDWNVTILATDINEHFLHRAAAGSYGTWSFRQAAVGFKEAYFRPRPERRFEIAPEIKRMVTFAYLNLAQDVYPSLTNGTNAMDLIFCRNVLMYFTPGQARKTVEKLHHCLLDGGWLNVSPSEVSQVLFSRFAARNFPGVIFYQRCDALTRDAGLAHPADAVEPSGIPTSTAPAGVESWRPNLDFEEIFPKEAFESPQAAAESFYEDGRYAEAAETLLPAETDVADSPRYSMLARSLANQGKLSEALEWCDRWIAAEKLDHAAHYLRAMVLLEQRAVDQAHASLLRTLYLQPDFVLAHFALGNLARSLGKDDEAERHFANALRFLEKYQPTALLEDSEGLTAGGLAEAVRAASVAFTH
jgi:chemotaxis protein methyltransferase CheR